MRPVAEMAEILDEIIIELKIVREDLTQPKPDKIELIYYKLLLEFGFEEKVIKRKEFNFKLINLFIYLFILSR